MSLHEYRFRNVWSVEVAAARLFGALVDLTNYPRWWPDVRSVHRVDEDTAELTCRAVLPYALVFRLHRVEQDERAGRLRVDLSGDLAGYCEGVVAAGGAGPATLAISQRVVVNKSLLRRLAPVARPLFRANHAAMMRRGQRGLRRYLAGPDTA
ncbi:MAG TPA: polyketide cyclase [Actinophytocola sp.]|uniref:polyketide cyclase n=1 Tax=Actinophytocola sp. TaxID=1872138 RepID=UPI002DB6FC92|nr:polyketide cyclase [Actinophytocola sp.]HEU5475167.1 polyketide cyclase [Actinophytocola sp.]